MTERTRDKVILLAQGSGLTKEALKEKLIEIACAYGRGRAREEYAKRRKISQEELRRGIWRNEDLIFLEQEIETECAGVCSKWADRLEDDLNDLIEDYLAGEADDEK
jgi:hypothetical protein